MRGISASDLQIAMAFHVFQQVDDLLFFKDMSILVVQTGKVSFREKRAENVTSQLLSLSFIFQKTSSTSYWLLNWLESIMINSAACEPHLSKETQ